MVKTNASWFPCSKASALPSAERRNAWQYLKLVIDGLAPAVVLAHGRPACDAVAALWAVRIEPRVEALASSTRIRRTTFIGFPHLSGAGIPAGLRGVGDDSIRELTQVVSASLAAARP